MLNATFFGDFQTAKKITQNYFKKNRINATFVLLVQSIFRSILDPPKEIKSLIQCPKKVPLALNWS